MNLKQAYFVPGPSFSKASLSMRTIAILNPVADDSRTGKRRSVVEAALHAAGLEGDVWVTQAPGHAVELARRAAAEAEVVLAVGGDGTIHEVCRGLLESLRPVHLGVIPLGTGNDFAKMLGMARHPEAAARQLATAAPRAVDYGIVRWIEEGRAGERVFVNNVGIGFDAQVAIEAVSLKFLPGFSGYLAAVLRTLRRWDGPAVRITGVEASAGPASVLYEGRLLFVTAGNGVCSGGMFYLTPRASITDGLLDLCLVEYTSTWRIVQVIPRAIRGRHETEPEVHTARIRTLRVASEAGLPIHTDGEIAAREAHTIEVDVVPGGLSVLMPM